MQARVQPLPPLSQRLTLPRSLVAEAIEQTILSEERLNPCNSMLLLGPRGSGKSLVAERALARVTAAHPGRTVIVRLSGAVHSDETNGLRCVLSQLSASLLVPGVAAPVGGSTDVSLRYIASNLAAYHEAEVTAIFVLDEFDSFAPQRGNQMLLYSLLDAVQADCCRAVVLGLSVRGDAAEMLEKRVRSRFSHRTLHLPVQSGRDARAMFHQLLRLPPSPQCAERAAFADAWNAQLDHALRPRGAPSAALTLELLRDRTPRAMAHAAMLCLSALEPGEQVLSDGSFTKGLGAIVRCPREDGLRALGPTQLHLLVAAVRLRRMRAMEVFNFGALHAEYRAALATLDANRIAPRDVVLHAFDSLLQLSVFEPADAAAMAQTGAGRTAGWLKEHAGHCLALADAVVVTAVERSKTRLTNLEHLLRHETGGVHGAPAL